ncbi:MAG TPA: stage II sporulation protein P [Thermaerobacter sp.]
MAAAYLAVVLAVFLFLAGLSRTLPGQPGPSGVAGGEEAVPALAGAGGGPGGDKHAGGDAATGGAGTTGNAPAARREARPDLWQALGERVWGWRAALTAALPGAGEMTPPGDEMTGVDLGRELAERVMERLVGIRLDEPLSIVAAQFPAAQALEVLEEFEEEGGPAIGQLAPPAVLAGGLPRVRPEAGGGEAGGELAVTGDQPRVLIYHTHTSEAYVGAVPVSAEFDPAVQAFTNDPGSSVVGAGTVVQSVLERRGIGTVHLKQVFDRDGQRVTRIGNYQRSLAALTGGGKGVLDRYPSVDVVLDIHRDGIGRDRTVTTVRGQRVATVLFVVGTNRRLDHPEWHKNYCFVQWIVRELNRRHPGLVRGVLVSDNRYNQHVRPGAVLVEIGGYGNTPEEAERSAEMLGEGLAAVIEQGRVPKRGQPFACPPGVQPPGR